MTTPLRELESKRTASVEDLLGELVRQIKIANMDPEYWEIVTIDVDTPTTLPPQASKTLLETRERGKVIAIGASTDNPELYLEVQIDTVKMAGSPRDLYDYGLIGFNPATFWLSKADVKYIAWFTPIPPRDYFGYFRFTVYNKTNNPISYAYSVYRYKLRESEL